MNRIRGGGRGTTFMARKAYIRLYTCESSVGKLMYRLRETRGALPVKALERGVRVEHYVDLLEDASQHLPRNREIHFAVPELGVDAIADAADARDAGL